MIAYIGGKYLDTNSHEYKMQIACEENEAKIKAKTKTIAMTRTDIYFSNHMREWWKQPVKDQSSLEAAKAFIRKHLSPDEVFSKKELQIFYEDNKQHLENKMPVNY